MVIISGIVCIYYNIIITWTLYYLFKSFQANVPWATCNNEWNDEYCASNMQPTNLSLIGNETVVGHGNWSYEINSSYASSNLSAKGQRVAASEQFWE